MSTTEAIENAIEAAEEARQAILTIDPSPRQKKLLDETYVSLKSTIENLSKLLGE